MLLQQAVKSGQVLDYELTKNPLVRLDAQQGGGEVGGREEVFDQGAHHPQRVLLLQEEQQTGNHLRKMKTGRMDDAIGVCFHH